MKYRGEGAGVYRGKISGCNASLTHAGGEGEGRRIEQELQTKLQLRVLNQPAESSRENDF